MKSTAISTAVVLVLLGGWLLMPVKTTMVPAWRIRVVDEAGNPYQGQKVRQFCTDYTLDLNLCTDSSAAQFTDQDGYVRFPERAYSTSTAFRIFATLKKSLLVYIAHDSMGTSVYVDSSGPAGYATLEYTSGMGEPPETFLVKSANEP